MSTVKRAIIMAAGTGSRMMPVTLEIPKPLIKVNGIRMIDSVIQGLHNNGIYEIYVVVGYLKEKFYFLEEKYEQLRIIENPYFSRCNNISSLYVARDHIEDAIILDGDQMIYNDKILDPHFEYSGYNAIWTDTYTDEWLMTLENGFVIRCDKNGGSHGWQLFSISRWNKQDAQKLKKYITEEFITRKNTQLYWDDIPMFYHLNDFHLGIRKMNREDIIEIDSLDELIAIDPTYIKYKEI